MTVPDTTARLRDVWKHNTQTLQFLTAALISLQIRYTSIACTNVRFTSAAQAKYVLTFPSMSAQIRCTSIANNQLRINGVVNPHSRRITTHNAAGCANAYWMSLVNASVMSFANYSKLNWITLIELHVIENYEFIHSQFCGVDLTCCRNSDDIIHKSTHLSWIVRILIHHLFTRCDNE